MKFDWCFRPLSGNLIFQLIAKKRSQPATVVSVPCRGILFFNSKNNLLKLAHGFRPLSGNLIFQ